MKAETPALLLFVWMLATKRGVLAFQAKQQHHYRIAALRSLSPRDDVTTTKTTTKTPWTQPKKTTRFRQHVNPLSKGYQMPTILSEEWPRDTLTNVSRPLHLDIGCGKGGFLIELALSSPSSNINYLGLEIRPSVAQYAKERINKRDYMRGRADVVGCNANVDLDRLLRRYAEAGGGPLRLVSIQFPDPHFKTQHAKRRVVTPSLVHTLAQHMTAGSTVFLQSDVQPVLDDMRSKFRESPCFRDQIDHVEQYLPHNPIGIPTERETSVLVRNLPVYRTLFTRTSEPSSTERKA